MDINFNFMQSNWFMYVILTLLVLFIRWILTSISKKVVKFTVSRSFHDKVHPAYINKMINGALWVVTILVILGIWGIHISGAWVVLSSIFGILGIGFFAVWSLLSNITSGLILFFTAPFKIGDEIFVDDSGGIQGVVKDLSTMYVIVEHEDGRMVNIPNNVLIQKAVFTRKST